MHVVDHAIVIPRKPSEVWAFLADIEKHTLWREDIVSISYLNSIRSDVGMRWRSVGKKRNERVVEIKTWYEGLGFEYTVIDGVSYLSNRGRIRLQEIAEGTLVQWTFHYETTGLMSSLRNVTLRRNLSNEVVGDLRQLYKVVLETPSEQESFSPKSVMRDAPSVEERLLLKTRSASSMDKLEAKEASVDALSAIRFGDEPGASVEADYPPVRESAIAFLTEPEFDEGDTRPNPVIASVEHVEVLQDTTAPDNQEADISSNDPSEQPPEPQAPDLPIAAEEITLSDAVPDITHREWQPAQDTETGSGPEPVQAAEVSVFQLFGIPRPSETAEFQALQTAEAASYSTTTQSAVDTPTPGVQIVQGERARLRHAARRNRIRK
jgi:hypothetical protein